MVSQAMRHPVLPPHRECTVVPILCRPCPFSPPILPAPSCFQLTIQDGKYYLRKVLDILQHNLPSSGGFSAGFLLGLRA